MNKHWLLAVMLVSAPAYASHPSKDALKSKGTESSATPSTEKALGVFAEKLSEALLSLALENEALKNRVSVLEKELAASKCVSENKA